jgi:hypothetical protein
MSPLQRPSALKDESADSPRRAVSHEAKRLPELTQDDSDPNEISLLIVTGCLSAATMASLACRLPSAHTLSWATIFSLSFKYIAVTALAGTVGTSIPWLFLKGKPFFSLASLSKQVGIGWIFFPCITLLYRQQSPSMFLALVIATIALALNLRRLLPASAESEQGELPAWHTGDLPSLYGLPIADFHPLRAFFMAVCGQTALILAVAEYLRLAGILLSTCVAMFVWRWSALNRSATEKFPGSGQSILLCALAFIFTMLALLPWIGGKSYASNKPSHKPALVTHESGEGDVPGSEYVGIILWPPPVKKTEIIPPRPHSTSFEIGKSSKPVVIPFDGQYWYFKAPSKRPGPHAHIAHGRSTYANVHSTNSAPLLMEAYQNLGTSIDLSCCSEIDIAITNNDIRPGIIALGLRLADSSSIGEPSLDLPERTIVSSQPAQISLNRPPVQEVLRFPIPRPTTIHRFNEITIVFLPAPQRAHAGAKVSIESFTLIP